MKFVKILNILALLLIFTPFIKYCSEGEEQHHTKKDNMATVSKEANQVTATKSEREENLWDKITVSKVGNYITGWGMVFLTITDLVEFKFNRVALEFYSITISFFLLIFTLYKLIAAKFKRLTLYYLINLLLIVLSFYLVTGGFHDADTIKWGFYAYLTANTMLFVLRLIVRKHCKKESIESILEQT
jgi:membrane-associated HD superfamily phosphohydrolase